MRTSARLYPPDIKLEVLGRVLDVLEVHVKVIKRHRAACNAAVSVWDDIEW